MKLKTETSELYNVRMLTELKKIIEEKDGHTSSRAVN